MKQLSQLLALFLPGANTLQLMIIIATIILLLKIGGNKLLATKSKWRMRKQKRQIENNMWAIE